MTDLKIKVEFWGGAEQLFGNKKTHEIVLESKEKQWIVQDLLIWLRDNLLQERPELFLHENSVRPGILVLINETDWELMDTINYALQPNDSVLFISTLHGG